MFPDLDGVSFQSVIVLNLKEKRTMLNPSIIPAEDETEATHADEVQLSCTTIVYNYRVQLSCTTIVYN